MRTNKHRAAGKLDNLERALIAAIDEALRPGPSAITPRGYVAFMTMSSIELGRRFKQALRDELYERQRRKIRDRAARATKTET
ncbi:hypothetical protein [Paraburkholderia humisilvae]|uniref:Uncharacterized protein n=1 Tax=Paraburkholderia humisilvae TaxID=627669 RepID=A0A6J5DNJ4_9BURK|nr:hypothetical protein LMG29542_02605 [Paraburkholderia humisilvae]